VTEAERARLADDGFVEIDVAGLGSDMVTIPPNAGARVRLVGLAHMDGVKAELDAAPLTVHLEAVLDCLELDLDGPPRTVAVHGIAVGLLSLRGRGLGSTVRRADVQPIWVEHIRQEDWSWFEWFKGITGRDRRWSVSWQFSAFQPESTTYIAEELEPHIEQSRFAGLQIQVTGAQVNLSGSYATWAIVEDSWVSHGRCPHLYVHGNSIVGHWSGNDNPVGALVPPTATRIWYSAEFLHIGLDENDAGLGTSARSTSVIRLRARFPAFATTPARVAAYTLKRLADSDAHVLLFTRTQRSASTSYGAGVSFTFWMPNSYLRMQLAIASFGGTVRSCLITEALWKEGLCTDTMASSAHINIFSFRLTHLRGPC
jgi:hypothetical protein